MKDTQWKQIEEFPDYWVGFNGCVILIPTGSLIKVKRKAKGNSYVTLRVEGKTHDRSIAKLQILYFGGMGINHESEAQEE